jgi:hypothetical protein
MNPERTDAMFKTANDANQAIQTLKHATTMATIPAPVAYVLLGSLSEMQDAVAQLARQIATGLERSLSEFEVYDDARDPGESLIEATAALTTTAINATRAAEFTSKAQAAIACQGFYLDKEDE